MPNIKEVDDNVPELDAKSIKKAFSQAVINLGNDIMARRDLDVESSGSTLVSCLIRGNLLLCANVGDSRAVLGRMTESGMEAVALSVDQKPDLPREAHRIKSFGGIVEAFKNVKGEPEGPLRIWDPHTQPPVPGLAMTRSIGDKIASSIGLIYKPKITETRLTPDDKFIILASDGIWEFISNQKAVEIVEKHW